MGHTALVLGDQLMRDNPALDGADRVLFVEALAPLRRVRTHRRRAHLVFSAMRHFAAELEHAESVRADSFAEALQSRTDVVCAEPNSLPAREHLRRLGVRLIPSNQFLGGFADWAFGALRDHSVPLNIIFGVFAGFALVSVLIVLRIRPRVTEVTQ